MSNSLTADFSAFIESRLNYVERKVSEHTDYKCQNDNIESATKELLAAMSPKMALTLSDMDDSYLKIINLSERVSYRQGFKDALRLFAEI